jgi:hypothetical protein
MSSLDGLRRADSWLPAGAPLADPLASDLPPGVHRVRSRSATYSMVRTLGRAGWATAVVDLAGAADKSAVLEAFARGLAFPAWVGRNWDALDDALADLAWWPTGDRGRVIVIRGAGRAATSMPRDLETLRDVLATAATRWAVTETPLVVLLRR